MPWLVEQLSGPVRELHQRPLGSGPPCRRAAVLHPVDRALVIGSTQGLETVDTAACANAGIEVVRRRSGGAAVFVQPGDLAWVDLFVPSEDPLWHPDVGRASWWVGEAWARALEAGGFGHFEVWKGPMQRLAWSSLVCFAGLGPGEVTDERSMKVVGISQRRSRLGAWFQCACLSRWAPEELLALLALSPGQRATALPVVASAARGLGPRLFAGSDGDAGVIERFLAALP